MNVEHIMTMSQALAKPVPTVGVSFAFANRNLTGSARSRRNGIHRSLEICSGRYISHEGTGDASLALSYLEGNQGDRKRPTRKLLVDRQL